MKIRFVALLLALAISGAVAAEPRLKIERAEQRLNVRARAPGQEQWLDLATFVMDPQLRPYLHPLRDPSGSVVLTEDRPADHPWQHGIFTGFHRVNGFNYWKEDEGRQRFVRLLDSQEAVDRVSWRALVELVAPDGTAVLEEEEAITFHAPESADTYVIDFDLLLRAKEREVNFGKFFVGGLAVRMPWDKANPRQTHLNSDGLRNHACEQKRAAWCNVERPFGGDTFGIAVFDHPSNPNHPPGWRADEQGLINPNVSALGDWSLPAKQERLFRYRLLVYRGSATREQLAERFAIFAGNTRVPVAASAAAHQTNLIEGWTVLVNERLLAEQKAETAKALELLRAQLQEIVRVVPAPAVAKLREVTLWFSPEYPGVKPKAEYHPGAGWLREHGRDPTMVKGIEFTDVRNFEAETHRMPNFTLHELAHAYHHRELKRGFDNAEIKAAYDRAKASGNYEKVERWFGNGRPNKFERAYAMTDPMEYFAETTEAFFSRNDFFPFNRAELKQHDPEMDQLLGRLWGITK